ncbi:unnamed protein product [Closterium sp. Yama58-4]|nr:unnamed protein product [Closterium sp. Yama58-4]
MAGRTDETVVLLTGLLAALAGAASALEPDSSVQHMHVPATALHLLQNLVQIVCSVATIATALLWWTGVSQAQARACVVQQGLALNDGLLKLTSAAISFLEYAASTFYHKTLGMFKKEEDLLQQAGVREGVPVRSGHPGGTRGAESGRGILDKCT